MKKLEGTWLLVSAEEDGNKVADDAVKAKVVISGDRMTVNVGRKSEAEFPITLDPSKKPKTMDIAPADRNNKALVIYELDGDTLRICSGLKGQRPTEFTGKFGSDCGLYVYKRDKK